MADDNGKKDPIDQVVGELRALRSDVNTGFALLSGQIKDVNARLDSGLEGVNARLDKVIENTGGHYRRLEERVAALEAKVH